MPGTEVSLPPDWLEAGTTDATASDLDLAVVLLNTVDALADPVDRLTDLHWFATALTQLGHGGLARHLRPADAAPLRRLREDLRTVFRARTVPAAAAVLNPRLVAARAVPLLVRAPDGAAALAVAPDRTGYPALAARLPAAVAAHVAGAGVQRLGTCAADPCSCAFVDRTRAGTRRYCCSWCNDRAAARAYRRRRAADR